MKILIIEDNPVIAQTLRYNLKAFYSIDICKSGASGLEKARCTPYDTILLDLGLPDMDGMDVCDRLRQANINTPVIILTGRGELESKLYMLNSGADDYITKPFNMQELHARINVAMRHASNNSPEGNVKVNDLSLDPISRNVKRDGAAIELRRKEFDLLEYLMRNKGQTLTRTMILDHIWDNADNLWANVVDVHIKHLRDKVDKPYEHKLIRTVHGVGYKIIEH
jgi:DNA-binding response OmpR family regulator